MKKIYTGGFTLIEIIVSISILSIIMISVFMIFMLSADLNNKTDISRAMQENIKNLVEIISNDVRNHGITGVNTDIVTSDCHLDTTQKFMSGSKLCVGGNSYYLAKKVAGVFNRVGNYDDCNIGVNACYLVKNDGTTTTQLSNSWVEFRNLEFLITTQGQKKVTLQFEVQPAISKGIKMELVKENKINFETTFSERLYNN